MTDTASRILFGGMIVTMDAERRILRDGAIAIRDGAIVDVGPSAAVLASWQTGDALHLAGQVVLPGLVNAHVHITGADLFPGLEPSGSPQSEHLSRWTLPAYEHSAPEDERATARFVASQMLRHGTTAFIEAGTCRFPEAVLDGLADMRIRGAIGTWAWDRSANPAAFATDTQQALQRIETALGLAAPAGGRVQVWPDVLGPSQCSDELLQAAFRLAREHDRRWTFHLSPRAQTAGVADPRRGQGSIEHLDDLGVLDERCVLGHAIHVSAGELDLLNASGASVAFCPSAALHLPSGITRTGGRHPEMRRVALGTDAQNASNHMDLLRVAGRACDLYAEIRDDRASLTAERALEWLTLGGAEALGLADQIGSLEVGKRADVAVFDVTQPVYNAANALIFGSTRSVHTFIDGEHVLKDGRIPGEQQIVADVAAAGRRVAMRAGLPLSTGWPLVD